MSGLTNKMPYFPEHRTLFIHIPKNAGKAIESALKIKFYGDHSLVGARPLSNRFSKLLLNMTSSKEPKQLLHGTLDFSLPAQHLTLNEIALLLPNILNNSESKKFAILRNPYERAVSIFSHLRTNKIVINRQNFDKFLKDLEMGELCTLPERIMTRPQSSFIINSSGAIGVDNLLRFECLEKDFNNLLVEYNITAAPLCQVGDKISPEMRSALLVNSTKKQIERIYSRDFEIWESIRQS
jgi:hypothetical protein